MRAISHSVRNTNKCARINHARSSRTTLSHPTKQTSVAKRTAYFKPSFERDPRFSKLTQEDEAHFKNILGPSGVITAREDKEGVLSHNTDWMHKFQGQGSLVLRPKTTEQVSKILSYCNSRKLAVVPQGGNTGLVGGSVPVFDEIVLSTSLMNKITAFDEVSGIVTCQAGVVLANLESYVNERGYTIPLDLGAKGSCQIGGNVATNAGGVRLLRYGSLHGSVLGLEVVLADGTIVDNLQTLRKDNTGYDVKQLFIGSEGTLGVITSVVILTPPKPKAVQVAFLACKSFEHVKDTYRRAKEHLGEVLSAVEFLDRESMELVLKHQQGVSDPFGTKYPFYILIETSGSNQEHDEAKLMKFVESTLNAEVEDGTIATQTSQIHSLWKLRETISESLQRQGTVYKYDISLPLHSFYDAVTEMRKRIGSKGGVVGYGHIGDGNLHLNIHTPKFDPEVYSLIEPFVYEWTAKYRGSISAEHGLGVMKPDYIYYSKTDPMVEIMKAIKKTLDPNGILNPYKVIPRVHSIPRKESN